MGSWRKVGAFLGLVPDEGRRDEFGDEYPEADGYRDDYDGPTVSTVRTTEPLSTTVDDFDRGTAGTVSRPRARSRRLADEPMTHGALAVQARAEQRREPESARRHPAGHGQTDRLR